MDKRTELDLLLNEFRALCVMYASGHASLQDTKDYQGKILALITPLQYPKSYTADTVCPNCDGNFSTCDCGL